MTGPPPAPDGAGAPADRDALADRVVELEVKVAFQEQLLGDLDEALRALRDELDAVRTEQRRLLDQLDVQRGVVVDEKPPHW